MSKYYPLWEYIKNSNKESGELYFSDVEKILGFPIDHSFLTYKNELLQYGYSIKKISLKESKLIFTIHK